MAEFNSGHKSSMHSKSSAPKLFPWCLVGAENEMTYDGMTCYCAHAQFAVVGDAVKAGGRRSVRHVAHDSEGVGHSLLSIVATK